MISLCSDSIEQRQRSMKSFRREGWMRRLISVNGKAPTPDEMKNSQDEIQKFLSDLGYYHEVPPGISLANAAEMLQERLAAPLLEITSPQKTPVRREGAQGSSGRAESVDTRYHRLPVLNRRRFRRLPSTRSTASSINIGGHASRGDSNPDTLVN